MLSFSKSKTGALIVLSNGVSSAEWVKSGVALDALLSASLLESLFYKNSALHDGAVIIQGHRVIAAGCVLPLSDQRNMPRHYGIRHRAGLGVTESSGATALIVSEETGKIACAHDGKIQFDLDPNQLLEVLKSYYKDKT